MRLGSTLSCRIVQSTSSHHRPWQIALAVTAGMLLGILPKFSLLFLIVGIICFVIPAHLPLLVVTAILISFTSPLLESTLGRIGLWSLTHPQLAAYWMRLDSLPWVPWLGIHNTVEHGSLVAWLAAAVPVYVSCRVVSRILIDEATDDAVATGLLSTDASSYASAVDTDHEIRPLAGMREPGSVRVGIEPPIVIWDDIQHDQQSDDLSRSDWSYFDMGVDIELGTGTEAPRSDQVIRRAAETAAWAEELITDELLMDEQCGSTVHGVRHKTLSVHPIHAAVDDEERWLIETTMEMVRIAERAVTNQAALKARQSDGAQDGASHQSSTQESSEIQTGNAMQAVNVDFQLISSKLASQSSSATANDDVPLTASPIRREQFPHADQRSHLDKTRAGVPSGAGSGVVNQPREEALHYLLRHLKGIQQKAQNQ